MTTMVWTDEQIEMLTTLWKEGKSASEIATFIGGDISRNAIIGKAHRLGLSGRPSPIKKKKDVKTATLYVLTERMCKWPFGDPKKPDFHFCGKTVDVMMTYCPEHRAMAYTPSRKPIAVLK
ncbi:MAG: GcrA family cell cycle regulator [Rhodospirillaceae bacterium]